MQVTLDGPPEIHNKRRRLLDGGETFQVIYDNIINTLQKGFSVSIRMNTDKENASSLPLLFKILSKEKIIRERALLYHGQTFTTPCGCSDFPDDHCMSISTYSRTRYQQQSLLVKFGFKSGIKPKPKANACLSIGSGGYVIDPFGNLYKCWMEVGSFQNSVGKVGSNGEFNIDQIKLLEWLSYDPFKSECINCKILPLCMGGCYYYPVKTGTKRCSELKYRLKKYLFLAASQVETVNQNRKEGEKK